LRYLAVITGPAEFCITTQPVISMKKACILFCFFLSGIMVLHAQDKSQLEKEREDLRKEMQELQGAYDQLKGKKKQALGQLSLVQRKLSLQDRYVSTINREIRNIDDDIYISALEIIKLQRQLDTLKKQYSRSIVYAYKNRSTFDYLNFIFSAGSFNDALKRVQYLKSYRAFREQQVLNIVQTQKMIEDRKREQLVNKTQKNNALKDQAKQLSELAEQKKEKDKVMNEIRSQEKDFKKQLAEKKKKDSQIKNAITAIVRREIDEARKKAEADAKAKAAAAAAAKKAAPPPTKTPDVAKTDNTNPTTSVTRKPEEPKVAKSFLDYSASDIELNNSFEKNKGKLPWPVEKGFVSMVFGRNKIDNLVFDNPGITITTPSAGVSVKSVFNGEVAAINNLGDAMMITIRHGKYFTVYSNLSSVSVSKNDQISTGQVIGKAAAAEDGDGGQVDMILMIEKNNVNPQPWLHK
jgi:murein hydrolase activator